MLNKHSSGIVFFGVDNKGNIVGLKDQLGEETIKKISTRINEFIKPIIAPDISFL